MANNVLISGYIGFANFGDEALLSVLVTYLKSKGVNVCALSSNPELTSKTHKINALRYKNVFDIFKGVKNCDILFSGGGSLLQNATSNLNLFYYLFIIFLSLLLRKDVVIFAQGIGPIKGFFSKCLTRFVLKKCKLVTVRNQESRDLLSNWGVISSLVCDPAWELELPDYSPQGIVGIQLRPYKRLCECYMEKLGIGINSLFSDRKIQIFPFQNSLDFSVCNRFKETLKRINPKIDAEVVVRDSIKELVDDFSRLDYLIAMRFHSALLGLKFGVKTLPIVYDEKVESLAKELGINYLTFDDIADNDFFEIIKSVVDFKAVNRKTCFDWSRFDRILGVDL